MSVDTYGSSIHTAYRVVITDPEKGVISDDGLWHENILLNSGIVNFSNDQFFNFLDVGTSAASPTVDQTGVLEPVLTADLNDPAGSHSTVSASGVANAGAARVQFTHKVVFGPHTGSGVILREIGLRGVSRALFRAESGATQPYVLMPGQFVTIYVKLTHISTPPTTFSTMNGERDKNYTGYNVRTVYKLSEGFQSLQGLKGMGNPDDMIICPIFDAPVNTDILDLPVGQAPYPNFNVTRTERGLGYDIYSLDYVTTKATRLHGFSIKNLVTGVDSIVGISEPVQIPKDYRIQLNLTHQWDRLKSIYTPDLKPLIFKVAQELTSTVRSSKNADLYVSEDTNAPYNVNNDVININTVYSDTVPRTAICVADQAIVRFHKETIDSPKGIIEILDFGQGDTLVEIYGLTQKTYVDTEVYVSEETIPMPVNIISRAWSVDDPTIATIDNNGKLKAIKNGTVEVSLLVNNRYRSITSVQVLAAPVITIVGSNKVNYGETGQYTYTIAPTDAPVNDVKWKSSDATVLTIDNNGNWSAKKVGTATITVTINGVWSQTLAVEVAAVDAAIVFDGNIYVGENAQLDVTIDGVTVDTVVYTSASPNILKVTNAATGEITAVAKGSAKITAVINGIYTVERTIPVGDAVVVTVTHVSPIELKSGKQTFDYTVNAGTVVKSTALESSDITVITANPTTMEITPIKVGTSSITVTVNTDWGSYTASKVIEVNVITIELLVIGADNDVAHVGDAVSLGYSMLPSNYEPDTVVYSSSDPTIASVNATTGVVTTLKPGMVTLTVLADGEYTDSKEIEIYTLVIHAPDKLHVPMDEIIGFTLTNADGTITE